MTRPIRPCLRCKKRHANVGGYCDACMAHRQKTVKAQVARYDNIRGSSAARGYGRDWEKVRRFKLGKNPLCECARCKDMCRVLVADTVHHIKPVETHPHLRLNIGNLKSMSAHCHEVEHGRAKDYAHQEWEKQGMGGGR